MEKRTTPSGLEFGSMCLSLLSATVFFSCGQCACAAPADKTTAPANPPAIDEIRFDGGRLETGTLPADATTGSAAPYGYSGITRGGTLKTQQIQNELSGAPPAFRLPTGAAGAGALLNQMPGPISPTRRYLPPASPLVRQKVGIPTHLTEQMPGLQQQKSGDDSVGGIPGPDSPEGREMVMQADQAAASANSQGSSAGFGSGGFGTGNDAQSGAANPLGALGALGALGGLGGGGLGGGGQAGNGGGGGSPMDSLKMLQQLGGLGALGGALGGLGGGGQAGNGDGGGSPMDSLKMLQQLGGLGALGGMGGANNGQLPGFGSAGQGDGNSAMGQLGGFGSSMGGNAGAGGFGGGNADGNGGGLDTKALMRGIQELQQMGGAGGQTKPNGIPESLEN
jgi:hypothetical protein